MYTVKCAQRLHAFRSDSDGGATAWSIMWTIIFLVMGGLAIDTANAFREQEFLQVTADASAHAGAVEITFISQTEAKTEAIRVAGLNMRPSLYGNVLKDEDITLGRWDHENRFLDTASAQPDAVRVITRRSSANSNSVKTILLKLVGFDDWNLGAMSTVQRFVPSCIMDGVVAAGTVEISSNNTFIKGYCLHGQQGVKINSNNGFEGKNAKIPGVVVSMGDMGTLQLPSSGMESNAGLAEALAEDWMNPRAVDRIDEWLIKLSDPTSPAQPSFFDPTKKVVKVANNGFDPKNTTPGTLYIVSCNGGQQINFPANTTVVGIVLVTSCRISTAANLNFIDSIIATSNTSSNSISGAQGVVLGKDDDCTPGGGATFITAGGIDFAGHFEAYGSQVIARGDIKIAANSNGVEGASFQTAGDFKMTSNGAMGNCIGNVDLLVVENYYRIVE